MKHENVIVLDARVIKRIESLENRLVRRVAANETNVVRVGSQSQEPADCCSGIGKWRIRALLMGLHDEIQTHRIETRVDYVRP